jgi:beta-glucanase (GH16 family)
MKIWMTIVLLATFPVTVAGADEWEIVWSDEFNDEGLPDPARWGYEEGFVRNGEMQYYTRECKENARVEKGSLIIEGRKEEVKNPKYKDGSRNWKEQREVAHYTSGSINTLGLAQFIYGRVEVRAKMPQGKGMWPAIWMMGINHGDVGWPLCGEIDIMEYLGKDPNTIHANNHFADPNIKDKAVHRSAGKGTITIEEPYKGFHVYAIEWDEKQIKFFVDDRQYSTFNIDAAGKGPDNPFRKPHYLLLNLALGGSWGGNIDDGILPQKYEIDYVRVFKAKTGQQDAATDAPGAGDNR